MIKKVVAVLILMLCFALPVVAGTASLVWNAVNTWDDGSPITTAMGYIVHYGPTNGGPYPVNVPVGNVTHYDVNGLTNGTWYFVVDCWATNSLGAIVTSGYSNQVTKTIDGRGLPAPQNLLEVSVAQS
jgi:hypothetical protein